MTIKEFFFPLALLVLLAGCSDPVTSPHAVKGHLDLGTWNFEKNGPVNLEGQWEFYWLQLFTPEDFKESSSLKKTHYIGLPGLWKGNIEDGIPLHSKGYATYRLRVKVKPDNGLKALLINDVLSVCKIWVNGKPVASGGDVGRSRETERPRLHSIIPRFYLQGNSLEIIIQVSNFHNVQGGINTPIWMGTAPQIQLKVNRRWISSAMLGGALLAMGLCHLAFFWVQRRERANLFFGLYCMLWSIQTLFGVSGGCLMAAVFPGLPWRVSIDLALLPFGITTALLIMFYHTLFPNRQSRMINRIFQAAGLVYILYVALTPPNAYDNIVLFFSIFSALAAIYLFYRFIIDLMDKREGVYLLIPGYTILALSAINDMLYDLHIINTGFLIPFGLFIFILSYSLLISIRFSWAFTAVENLTLELQGKNIELSRLDLLKDEFLANTSHELKTPLNGIIGIAESLRDDSLSGKALNGISMIVSSGMRLSSLINDLMDFSMLKKHAIELHRTRVDIRVLADDVLTVSRQLIKGRPLVIKNEIPHEFPGILGDENRLQQILFNLIGNAIKYTDRGEIRVSASVEDRMARILITDTGIGIPEDRLEQIFDSFEQVDKGPSRRYGGTGLGLAITRDLIELHSGKVGVSSRLGQGSSFWFTMPLCSEGIKKQTVKGERIPGDIPRIDPAMEPDGTVAEKGKGELKNYILAVDDDPVNLQVVVNHLEALKIDVSTCTSGQQALDHLNQNPLPELILLDIMMPVMTGYEMCRILRQEYSASDLPIIFLTARTRISDLVEGFKTGANDYLPKPFAKDELLARVKTQLKLKQAHEAFKENSKLKNELTLRKKTEQELKLIQRRLSGMLDIIDDALIAVNTAREISFINRAFERLTGHLAPDLLGTPFLNIFTGNGDDAADKFMEASGSNALIPGTSNSCQMILKYADGKEFRQDITLTMLELEEEQFYLLILKKISMGKDRANSSAVDLINGLNRNSQRAFSLEDSLNRLKAGEVDSYREQMAMDSLLDHLEKKPVDETETEKRRNLMVLVMNQSLDYWVASTGTSKIELADRSGIWNVYIGKDGWARTQTMDKYLTLETLPLKPRWKQVKSTADFVLATLDRESSLRQELEDSLFNLKKLF